MNSKIKPLLSGSLLLGSLLGPIGMTQANEVGLYMGAGVGQAEDVLLDESQSAFKAFVGINVTPVLGLELSYVDLGSYAGGALTQDGIAYELIGYIPLSRQLDLYGRAGLFNWEVADNTTVVTGTEPTFGLGVNIRLNPHASLRGEYQTFLDVDGGDVDLYSASLSFNF